MHGISLMPISRTRVALPLDVGVQRVGLDGELILQQAVEDVDGFPHAGGE